LKETYYTIDPTRSGEPAKKLLGNDWAGVLGHDGWSVYDAFLKARHQQCNAHLLRRCAKLIETARGKAIQFPQSIKELLLQGLKYRDLFRSGEPGSLGDPGLRIMARGLRRQLECLTDETQPHPANERLAKFLWNHLDSIFTYMQIPGIDATNWRGEQAIRPAVVNRKVWGGNRTAAGAKAQSVIMSVFRTCQNRSADAFEFIRQQIASPQTLLIPTYAR
jgi:transposase